jgi:hypothetical protein
MSVAGRGIGFADDIDFDYILESILDHAESLIAQRDSLPLSPSSAPA